LHVQKFTFEKEFDILSQLWETFVDLRESTLALNPAIDSPNWYTPEDQIENQQRKRLALLEKNFSRFFDVYEKNRPFYPPQIYNIVERFGIMAKWRELNYAIYDDLDKSARVKYWGWLQDSSKKILEVNNELCEAIRASNKIAMTSH
jgi:hypothetical protein